MKLVKCIDRMVRAIAAAVAVVRFMVILFVELVGLAVVAAGVVAYLKREQWTRPAYKWARDRSGHWSLTPWKPADKVAS
jgi:hypothetical protein